jgi:hypothetical protein
LFQYGTLARLLAGRPDGIFVGLDQPAGGGVGIGEGASMDEPLAAVAIFVAT